MPDDDNINLGFLALCAAMGITGFFVSGQIISTTVVLGLAGGVANNLLPQVSNSLANKLKNKLFSKNKEGMLNHDVQLSLLWSLEKAVENLRKKWVQKQVHYAAINILLDAMGYGHAQEAEVKRYKIRLAEIIVLSFNQDLDREMQDEKDTILTELDTLSRITLQKPFNKVIKELERRIEGPILPEPAEGAPSTIQTEAYFIQQSVHLLDRLKESAKSVFARSNDFKRMVELPANRQLFNPDAQEQAAAQPNQDEHNFNILSLLRDPDQIGNILIPFTFAYLKTNEELLKFVQQRLPGEWMFFFNERLKDPGPEGTKTWRALDKLYQQAMMDLLNEIKSDTSKIKGDTSKIPEIKQEVTEIKREVTAIRDMLLVLMQQGVSIGPLKDGTLKDGTLTDKQRETIQANTFRSKELQKIASELDATLDELKEVTVNLKVIVNSLEKATSRLDKTIERIDIERGKLDVTVGRLENAVDKFLSAIDSLPRILQENYFWILSFTGSFVIGAGLFTFMIYPDNYSRGWFWGTWFVWLIFIILATLPLWRFNPWNQTDIRIPQVVWYTLIVPYLAVLLVIPASNWERLYEFFLLPKMESQVNVIVSNFNGPEGKGIGTFIDEELRIRLKHLGDTVEIRYPHQRLFNGNDVREIANRWDANIVISGYELSQGDYQADFFMRDPVEGGIEITDGFVIDPNQDLEPGTSDRGNMITQFTIGLVNLFSDELLPDYPVRLAEALDSFQTTIDLVEAKDKEEGNKISDLIKSRVYFFQGRTEMQALLTDAIYSPYFTKSITWTDAISSYNKALELNPNDSWSYIGRGIVYYEQSVEQDPSDYDLLQDAYGEFDQALKLEENKSKNTPDPTAYIQGKAWVNIGNIWSILVDESREDEQVFTERYDIAVHAYESALREYAAAEERDNQTVDGRYYAHAHYGLGQLYLLKANQDNDQDMYDKARQSYATCLDLADSDDPRATLIRQLCEEGEQKAEDEIR